MLLFAFADMQSKSEQGKPSNYLNPDIVKVKVICNSIPIYFQFFSCSPPFPTQSDYASLTHAVTYQVHSIVLSDVNVLLPVSVSLVEKSVCS